MADELIKYSPVQRKILRLIHRGYTSGEIAKKMAPRDVHKQKRVRRQVQHLVAKDASIITAQTEISTGMILEAWPAVTAALIRRAMRGRVDAAKFLAEVAGIHNPRVKHEHSGDLHLSFSVMPRPAIDSQISEHSEPSVVDAEVVDDD